MLIPSPLTCLAAQNGIDAAKLLAGNSPCLVSGLWSCVGIVQDNELLQAAAAPGTGLAEYVINSECLTVALPLSIASVGPALEFSFITC